LIDLNRDAQDLSQNESKILKEAFNSLRPDLCLNLHGQRTIFGLENGFPATMSFLSPASNNEREVTPSRKEAMKLIVKMNAMLQKQIPGQVGRYDDSFNSKCFGDSFQMAGVPAILFEAGHFRDDYSREKTREFVFYSLLTLFEIIKTEDETYKDYFKIPENKKNYKDVIIRNVRFKEEDEPFSIAIQYEEKLNDGKIDFIPKLDSIGNMKSFYGHDEIQGNGDVILLNPQNNTVIGGDISTIISKNNKSLIYFNKNSL